MRLLPLLCSRVLFGSVAPTRVSLDTGELSPERRKDLEMLSPESRKKQRGREAEITTRAFAPFTSFLTGFLYKGNIYRS